MTPDPKWVPPSSPLPAPALPGLSLPLSAIPLQGLEPGKEGGGRVGEKSLKGCHVLLQRTRSARLLGTQTRRLWPGDKEIFREDNCGMDFSSLFSSFFSFFGLFLLPSTWVFSSLEVTALIRPGGQQQEADLLTENGKLKKKRQEWEGELILETSHPQVV